MQSSFIQSALPAGQRNYVFVDEHNRHKRLKVMRACEGCRRRKIKCDAATTNTWPCSACTRLKLQCVPPPTGVETEPGADDFYSDTEDQSQFKANYESESRQTQPYASFASHIDNISPTSSLDPNQSYNSLPQFELQPSVPNGASLNHFFRPGAEISPLTAQSTFGQSEQAFGMAFPPTTRISSIPRSVSDGEFSTAEELSEQLGDLRIGENGVAPYLRQQSSHRGEVDAPLQEIEDDLPALTTIAGSQVRIPPALMPSDEDAISYFNIFFRDLHPYVPVVCRNHFYHQWHTNRAAMSPLLLEAIFACAGRMSNDDSAEGAQWLALANRHEECFLDTPRLSTLQALLILLKAREASPKRGYYYRSWITCKKIVSMAKDLDLHEHHETHSNGELCGSDPVDCLAKTRIWQTIFICEMMIGGTQGRSDLAVDPNTVDISTSPPFSDIDDFEKAISRQFAYFIRNGRNIRLILSLSQKLKKKKDWALDPAFVAYTTSFSKWPEEVPKDLQVNFPADRNPPWLPSHFVGNMHSHYHLGIVMFHRPQLAASDPFASGSPWKHHMTLCYRSAKAFCRLQEAVLAQFGLSGLLYMQRGINFAIYGILTCTLIHLIAITSPDPDFNMDTRDYFERHMRILEHCMSSWPMPETEAQINALRMAFSADINKPFVLKSSFPYGSPSEQLHTSPPIAPRVHNIQIPHTQSFEAQQHPTSLHLITPPISAGTNDSRADSPQVYTSYAASHAAYTSAAAGVRQQFHYPPSERSWNPTPLIDQFNTAFAIPGSSFAPPSAGPYSSGSNMSLPFSGGQMPTQISPATNHPTSYPLHYHQPVQVGAPSQQQMPAPTPNYVSDAPVFVTPKDWQQSVASVFDPKELKRRWAYDHSQPDTQKPKRMR